MSENQSTDHWEQLASQLGTEPPSRELEERPDLGDEESPPSGGAAEPAADLPQYPPPPKRKKAPTDWGAVASALGVMTEPEAEESIARSRGGGEEDPGTAEFIEEARQELEAGEEEEEEEETIESPELAPATRGLAARDEDVPFAPELQPEPPASREKPSEVSELPAEEKPSEADVGGVGVAATEEEAAAEPSDKGTSRRRRRRRRKPRPGEKTIEGADAEPPEGESAEGVTEEAAAEEAEPGEPDEGETGEDEPRGKRRRKRRPAKRKKRSEAELAEALSETPEGAAAGKEGAAPRGDRDEAARPSRKGDGQKPSHRAIPTWGEAIGLIIEGNLERRKKGGGGPGRGRGRGRGRKGRSSSEGKSSGR